MVKNSKILVAGGTGFIGTNLILDLISKGNQVISLSNSPNKKNTLEGVRYIYHDLTKPLKTNKIKEFLDIDYIVNCSGYINHKSFLNGGKEVFYNHFESLYLLTNLAIEIKAKAFVHIGSSDEYGKNFSPLNESIRESPESPYALGKLSATHYLQQCHRQGILNTVIIRPFLVYGERQNKERFLPYLIDNCLNDREFKVTSGQQIRDYIYIKDFNAALIKALNNHNAYGEVINVASGIPISIRNVITTVKEIIGKGTPILGGIEHREGESMELYANIDKAKKILNWEPKYEFKAALKIVIDWYKNNSLKPLKQN